MNEVGFGKEQSSHGDYSEKAFNDIDTVESLPFSYAFEKYIYDNRVARTATHKHRSPVLLEQSISAQLPDEIIELMPQKSEYELSNLYISQSDQLDSDGNEEVYTNIHFESEGVSYEISGKVGDELNWKISNLNGDTSSHATDASSYLKFLHTIIYNQQYLSGISTAYDDAKQSISRVSGSDDARTAEAIILALGNISGTSEVKTSAMIDSGDESKVFLVELSESEEPHNSHFSNKLTFEEVSFADIIDSSKMYQKRTLVEVNALEDTSGNYIENTKHLNGDTSYEIILPENHTEYLAACRKFLKCIEEPLREYAHLDQGY